MELKSVKRVNKLIIFFSIVLFLILTIFYGIVMCNRVDTVKADEVDAYIDASFVRNSTPDELPNNIAYGEWKPEYNDYNCYSYAINYIEGDEELDRYREPGQMSGGVYNGNLSILSTAQLVKNDLLALGTYGDVYVTNVRPSILCDNEQLICVRKGSDFHFMKYHKEEGFWTHKPGNRWVLQYKHQPSNDLVWYDEYLNQYGDANVSLDGVLYVKYDSEIYYIVYNWEGFVFDSNKVIVSYTPPLGFDGEVIIPEGATGITENAFQNLAQVTNNFETKEIEISSTVTNIEEGAFIGCNNFAITIDDSNPYYKAENNIVYNKAGTKVIATGKIGSTITIPNTVTEIDEYAFYGNTNLTNIEFTSGLTTIGTNAFSGCVGLQSITIPNTVTEIGDYAFSGCTNLISIGLSTGLTTIGTNTFSGCTGLQSITIPSTVIEIDDYAFYGFTNLEEVHIWGNTIIRSYAFANCENLSEVYFYSYTVPTIEAYAFEYDDFTVFVPHSRQSAYGEVFLSNWYYIQSIPIQVTLKVDGQNYGEVINTYYGAIISGLPTLSREGHTFYGWEDENGVGYQNGDTWNFTEDANLNAVFEVNTPEMIEYSVSLYDYSTQEDGAIYRDITVVLNMPMPVLSAPQRPGYVFNGYYDQENGAGTQYYDANMNSMRNWDVEVNDYYELIAYWTPAQYLVTLDWGYDNIKETITVSYGQAVSVPNVPTRQHYEFVGYYDDPSGYGACYVTTETKQVNGQYVVLPKSTIYLWEQTNGGTLYARWTRLSTLIKGRALDHSNDDALLGEPEFTIQSGIEITMTAPSYSNYTFNRWEINGVSYTTSSITVTLELHISSSTGQITVYNPNYIGSASGSDGSIVIFYTYTPPSSGECVAAGTLITLADGSQVPVETLTGNEMLLVWNLHTGSFDIAPILFIDSDEAREYQIINLYFSDGTHVKVISEHGFWDFDLNRYVYLDANAGQYVGHWFNKQVTDEDGNLAWDRVQLINVTLTKEYTTAWSPVTYGHLCLYVNGMLSMPGATGGLVNTFEVDGTTMRIDEQSYLADIATYGLYTYEEFAQEYDVPEEIFNAVQGQYLKVTIGKGLIDAQGINALINSYSQFF